MQEELPINKIGIIIVAVFVTGGLIFATVL